MSHVQESTVLGEAEEAVKSLFAKETWDVSITIRRIPVHYHLTESLSSFLTVSKQKVLLKAQNVEQGVEKGLDDGTDIVKGVFTDDHWKVSVSIQGTRTLSNWNMYPFLDRKSLRSPRRPVRMSCISRNMKSTLLRCSPRSR